MIAGSGDRKIIFFKVMVACISLFFQGIITYHDCSLYLFIIVLCVAFSNAEHHVRRRRLFIAFSVLFASLSTFGNQYGMTHFRSVIDEIITASSGKITTPPLGILWLLYYISVFAGWYFLWEMMLEYIIKWMERINIFKDSGEADINTLPWKETAILAAAGSACYLPYFLRYFPGVIPNDGINQMSQVMGVKPYSNHHPWLHTMIIKLFYTIGLQFGGVSGGIAAYSLFSMITMAFIFSAVIVFCHRKKCSRIFLCVITVFYFLIPLNAMYSITMWKDTLFGGIVLIFSLVIYEYECVQKRWPPASLLILYIISVLFCLLRTNGFYAFLLFIVLLLIKKKREAFRLIPVFAAAVVTVLIFKGPVMKAAGVTGNESDPIESLSIPAQQIAAVITNDGNISAEQMELLSEVVDTGKVSGVYSPYISDGIKDLVREKGCQNMFIRNKGKYIELWIKLGIQNPGIYLKAYADQTRGYWYHNPGLYWVYARRIWDNDLGLVQMPLIKGLPGKIIDYIPALMLLPYYASWSSAATVWAILILLMYSMIHRGEEIFYYPALSVIFTLLIATPVANEFRYAYAAFVSLPFLFFCTYYGNRLPGQQLFPCRD